MSDSRSEVHIEVPAATVVTATRVWLERAVIGLQLCPFAKAVYVNDQVRYVVSEAQTADALREVLERELRTLAQADASVIDTTLLIHPQVLTDFLDYNDFLDIAEATVEELGLEGVVQIASFHPAYQFAGTPHGERHRDRARVHAPTRQRRRPRWPQRHVHRRRHRRARAYVSVDQARNRAHRGHRRHSDHRRSPIFRLRSLLRHRHQLRRHRHFLDRHPSRNRPQLRGHLHWHHPRLGRPRWVERRCVCPAGERRKLRRSARL